MRSLVAIVLCATLQCALSKVELPESWLHYPNGQKKMTKEEAADVGEPLFLTPYIENDQLDLARTKSRVHLPQMPSLKSFSGFVTVDKTYDSNMFFWMVPAEKQPQNKPLLVWLQGGPGASSILYGMLSIHGPFRVNDDLSVTERDHSWHKLYNIVYLDNPVGAGFSFTKNEDGYSKNQYEVGENLYRAMVQIMKLFPQYSSNGFYVSGESYAGKHVPSLGHRIYSDPNSEIVLDGIIVGAGWTDPPNMITTYPEFLFNIAQIDEAQRDYLQSQMDYAVALIGEGRNEEAFYVWDSMMYIYQLVTQGTPNWYFLQTGMMNLVNFVWDGLADLSNQNAFLELPSVHKAIHIGNISIHSYIPVMYNLRGDFMNSFRDELVDLMENYKVLYYAGQMDVIVAHTMTARMLDILPWSKLDQYKNAPRIPWKLHPEDEGVKSYVKVVDDFQYVMVRNAGHYTPEDEPEASFEMIRKFVEGEPY